MKLFSKPPKLKLIHVFSEDECNLIRQDFEKNKEHIKLCTEHGVERISSYEIDISYLSSDIQKFINKKIDEKIFPYTKGKKGMVFGVRYTLETKSYMAEHYDCNSYSCVISLNNNFEGGGTFFPLTGELVLPHTGFGCLFKADKINSYHSAYPIESGVRDVLVVRIQKTNGLYLIFKAIFLNFVDKYIRKNTDKYFQEPRLISFK